MSEMFEGQTIIITGGASGIGAALAYRLHQSGAEVAIADRDQEALRATAARIGCLGVQCDVTREGDIRGCIGEVTKAFGPVDMFVSNAGLFAGQPGHPASASDDVWMRNWMVHVMAHVYAARAILPSMLERGSGRLVQITSAAGLLNQIGNAAYSATKHAAVSFAESLAIAHGDAGLDVSVVCPQYVATPLLGFDESGVLEGKGLLTADQVAQAIIEGVEAGRFLILPHPEVALHAQRRAADHDRWIDGMRRLHAQAVEELGTDRLSQLYLLD
ncbi:SDR family oxidoreductase [uncultured Roseobacter sp.]|uniref:SDR family NAD(P)-dependent oxidoreductase n=1 Tax=uncultured Roseobacter sp. TaxID=114847 RepID=UPI00263A283C|nr:SDR family oxidoreductase [uncultured Roseobacter sp.]